MHTSILVSIAALLLSSCAEPPKPAENTVRELRVIRVGDASDISARAFPGRAAALQEVNLSFRVGGPLISLPVKVGDKVAAGQVIARIDPNDFEVIARNVSGELGRAQAELSLAEKEYQRAVTANAKNPELISASELDRRLSGRDRARADVKALEASLQAADDNVGYASLEAPFPGTVVNTYVENFETVREKQSIARVVDNTRVKFRFNLPETLITLLPTVQNLRVTFDAFPDLEIPAELDEVGSEASEVTRTYPVTLLMNQPDGTEILPGMAGRVMGTAVADTATDATLVVPESALFTREAGGPSLIWVVDPDSGSVSQREIVIRRLVATGVEVASGVQRGELIATAGVHFLEEGQLVTPLFD